MAEFIVLAVFVISLFALTRYGESQTNKVNKNISASLCSILLIGSYVMSHKI